MADGNVAETVSLDGRRAGNGETWQATLTRYRSGTTARPAISTGPAASETTGTAGAPAISRLAYVAVGARAWLRSGTGAWTRVDPPAPPTTGGAVVTGTLDQAVVSAALGAGRRLAAEDLGIEVLGGAPARHCRLAVDGPTALAAFRPLRWLIGQPPLSSAPALGVWRGELDWWVFGDDELGMARVTIGGQPPPGWGGVLQGTLTATLTARDRTAGPPITPPGG